MVKGILALARHINPIIFLRRIQVLWLDHCIKDCNRRIQRHKTYEKRVEHQWRSARSAAIRANCAGDLQDIREDLAEMREELTAYLEQKQRLQPRNTLSMPLPHTH